MWTKGKKLDNSRYKIEETLGSGGFGVTYKEAIIAAMQPDPENRPQSVKAWLDLLPKKEDVYLLTEVGVDYTKLRDLLAAGKWEEANWETERVMLLAVNKSEDDWLSYDILAKFPKTDFHTIDKLWVKYSSGRFGFSVLRRIWESLGGTKEAHKFGNRLGWRRKGEWYYYKDLVFDNATPQGHLPIPCKKMPFKLGNMFAYVCLLIWFFDIWISLVWKNEVDERGSLGE